LTPAWGCRNALPACWRAVTITTNKEVLDDNPMLELTLSSELGTMNWATDVSGGALKQFLKVGFFILLVL